MISLVVLWAFVALFASLFLVVIGALLRAAFAGFLGAVRKHRARGHSPLVSVLLVLTFVLVTPLTQAAGLGTAVTLPYIMIFGALYGIFRAIAANARNRFDFLQRNLATSRAGSVAAGLAEPVGRARPVEAFKGRLEVTLAGLDWISFPPTLESESAGYRYRECRLDDAHRVLVYGALVIGTLIIPAAMLFFIVAFSWVMWDFLMDEDSDTPIWVLAFCSLGVTVLVPVLLQYLKMQLFGQNRASAK